jgi:hypothetical protein
MYVDGRHCLQLKEDDEIQKQPIDGCDNGGTQRDKSILEFSFF